MRNNDFTINQPFDESFILSLFSRYFIYTNCFVITKQIEPSIFFIAAIKKKQIFDTSHLDIEGF